jgi:hypothetical protein
MTRSISRGLALFAFVALLAAPQALAQYWSEPQQPRSQTVIEGFTDAEIQAYASTYVQMEQIRSQFAAKLRAADDPAETEQIQQQFQEAVSQVMRDSELDNDRYDQLTMATQRSQSLSQAVMTRIQRAREGATSRR